MSAQVVWSGTGSITLGVTDPANWVDNAVPTTGSDVAFGLSAPATVNVPASVTLGNITFNNTSPTARPDYTFSGQNAAKLTIAGNAGITVNASGNVSGNGNVTLDSSLPVLLGSGAHTVNVSSGPTLTVAGNISQAIDTAGSVVKTGAGTLVLSGTNSYSGSTTLNAGTLKLGSSAALSSGTLIAAGGTVANGTGAALTLSNSVSVTGNTTFGANKSDSDIILNGSTSFANNTAYIGSFGRATVSGTVNTANDTSNNFNFGGGDGTLIVTSNLANPAAGSAGLSVVSSTATSGEDDHLTVILRGNNTFTGNVSVTASSLILDSANALPTGVPVRLSDDGYVGYTENSFSSFANFKSAITTTNSTRSSDTIIGIDSANSGSPRTVSDAIDLSGALGSVYLGTATNVTLSGPISNPSGGTLLLTGVNSGYLKITSPLTASANITAVKIGNSESEPNDVTYKGIVELANGASNYTGNTTLQSGYLLLGASSTVSGAGVTQGPIGKGTLVVAGSADTGNPALAASVTGITVHNPITINSGLTLQLGVPTSSNSNDLASSIQSFAGNSFTLAGDLSGAGNFLYAGTGTLTLTGAANYTGSTTINSGTLQIGNGGNLGSINGNITNNGTIAYNRSDNAIYSGILSGTGAAVKLGSGTLTVAGSNTYTGGTTISAGTLAISKDNNLGAAPASPTANSLTLNGGTLETTASLTLNSNRGISLGTGGGTLSPDTDTTLTYGGIIAGSNALTKTGGGTLTLSGSNTFSGGLSVNAGQVSISSDANLGASAGALALNNGVLATTANLTLGATRNVTIGTLGTGSGFSPASNTTLTVAGPISGGGSLTKYDNGTLVLAGANTYNGTTISFGELQLASTGSLATGADITINGSGVFRTFAANQTIRDLISSSANSQVIIESGATLNSNMPNTSPGNVSTFAGNITGAGSFIKNGPGTLTVTGTTNLTGLTTVSGGTLRIGDGGTTGEVTGNISTGSITTGTGTIDFNRSSPLTYAAVLSGNGTVIKDGSGNLTLTGLNTYSGTTNINGGALIVGVDNALPNAFVNVGSNGTFLVGNNQTISSLSGTGTTSVAANKTLTLSAGGPLSAVISGAGNVAIGNVVTMTANQTYTGTTTLNDTGNNLTLNLGNNTASGMVAGNIVTTTSKTGVQFNHNAPVTYGGVISGGGFLNKNNTNTLTLTGQNTYTGSTSVSGGTLVIGTPNALPTTTGLGLATGATLDVANDQTITRFVSNALNSAIKIEDGKTLTVALGSSLTTNNGNGTAFYGNITDGAVPGAGGKLVIGADSDGRTVGLFGDNTYTGGTVINANGKLLLGSNGASGSIVGNVTNNGQLIFNRGNTMTFSGVISGNGSVSQGTLSGLTTGDVKLTGANTYTGGTNVYAKALIIGDGGTTGSIVGNVALFNNATFAINRSDNTSFGGAISGTGSFVKASTGNLTLTGANTYTGNTTVMAGGHLVVGAANALPTTTQLAISAGAALDVNFNQTIAGFLTAGDLTSILNLAGSTTFTVNMPTANTTTTFAGTVNGSGTFAVSGAGGDVVNLTGTVASTVGTSIGTGATLNIASGGSLAGPIALGTGSVLTLANSGTQTFTNVISGAGSLKSSAGITTLTAPNTYTGGTEITGGKIIVSNTSGSATGTGPVVVGNGGILGGSGIITGSLALNAGSTVSPGNSPGTLTVGSTTFASGATFAFDINDTTGTPGTNWDILKITGPLAISATTSNPFTINLVSLDFGNNKGLLSNFDPTQTYSWQFVSTTGGITGFSAGAFQYNVSQFQNATNAGSFFVSQSGNNLFLNFEPVPEPSTWALLALGLGGFSFIALRRRRC